MINEKNKQPIRIALALSLIGLGVGALVVAIRRNAMTIGQAGIDLIKRFEGCRLESYQDSVGVWTIGYGHTQGVYAGQRITQEDAEALLRADLKSFSKKVSLLVGDKVNQQQFDALVSFAYNLGVGNLKSSTLLKRVLANPNDPDIETQFNKWVYAGGKILNGLVKRRQAEADLYFS